MASIEHSPSAPPATDVSDAETRGNGSEESGVEMEETVSQLREAKLRERRFKWRWNLKLLAISAVSFLLIASLSVGSYLYHSSSTASTFLQRAEEAGNEGDYANQVQWYRKYMLLKPSDAQIVGKLADAADQAAEEAVGADRYGAVSEARKQLTLAIARLGDANKEQANRLRKKLIGRLLQLGGPWYREAERQVIQLDSDPDDPESARWMSLALMGQVQIDSYQERSVGNIDSDKDYWEWLSHQPPGDVTALALHLNPGDLDLAAMLLIAQALDWKQTSNLSLFADDSEPVVLLDTQEVIESTVQYLQSSETSRSKLILLKHAEALSASGGNPTAETGIPEGSDLSTDVAAPMAVQEARQQLIEVADKSLMRLKENLASGDPSYVKSDIGQPEAYWDFLCVFQSASLVSKTDPERAENWYRELIEQEIDSVPAPSRVALFYSAGLSQLEAGKTQEAIAIWERGLEEQDGDNLDLLSAVVTQKIQSGALEDAEPLLKRYEQAIEVASRQLVGTSTSEMSQAARTQFGRKIDNAQWRLLTLRASVNSNEGSKVEAIRALENSLRSDADVPTAERITTSSLLASLYAQEGSWDQAAATLSRALEFAPEDETLRFRAAQAWGRAGNLVQAADHWRMLSLSDNPVVQAASAEATYKLILTRPPEAQDFGLLRTSLARAKQNLQKELSENPSERRREELGRVARVLDILDLSVPPRSVSNDDHQLSQEMVKGCIALRDKYAEDATVQAFVAERLLACSEDEESQVAMESLRRILDRNSTQYALAESRMDSLRGNYQAAADRMLMQASKDPSESIKLINLAIAYSQSGGLQETAYQALLRLVDESPNALNLFRIASVAAELPEDSEVALIDGEKVSVEKLREHWFSKLKALEGDQGAYWRFVQAWNLIDELREDTSAIDRKDPRLVEASKLIREVLSWRPRWGAAISLRGWILALEGSSESAVEQLRRGIAAGDRSNSTRQLLWEQLVLLNRDEEAARELQMVSTATDAEFDLYSSNQIQLTVRQGDYEQAVKIAEEALKRNPESSLGELRLCQTAMVAAAKAGSIERRQELIEVARAALKRAAGMPDSEYSIVLSTKLNLEIAFGSEDSVRQVLKEVEESRLDPVLQLGLRARGHSAIREFDQAIKLLKEADKIRPSTESKWALVKLYRQLRRQDEEVETLREAQRRSPNNPALRNELARVLASRDGADVDWDELSKLLSRGERITSENRFLYAVLLGLKGSASQQSESLRLLRQLIAERGARSDDAARYLGAILRKRLQESPDADEAIRDRWGSEARSTYETLIDTTTPEVVDLYRYAAFLLEQDRRDELPIVKRLLERLSNLPGGALAALQISIGYAQKTGTTGDAPALVEDWAALAQQNQTLDESTVATVAGDSLLQLGFENQGLDWLEKAYADDIKNLRPYVVALNRVGNHEKALQIAREHHEQHQDVLSAILMVDSLMNLPPDAESRADKEMLQAAMQRFESDFTLLESVATLRLQRGERDEAILLYQQVRELSPFRVRTLNNLAMALSEVPGRELEAIEPIDAAMRLVGEIPELLDTKGAALLRAGRLEQARVLFQQAMTDSDEPRFRFHLIMTLLEMGDQRAAEAEWRALDLQRLNPSGLTPAERARLQELKNQFNA